MIHSVRMVKGAVLFALAASLCLICPSTAAPTDAPPWPSDSVIYTIYPNIFSPQGNFAGITAQLGRLKALGVTDVWIMPVTPIGKAVNGHPAVGSPYSVHDYYAVNPDYGTPADLHTLVTKAHALGLRVILDQVLNHTAWDNALITQHPEYYVHSDGNPHNSASIKQAFNFSDVAQLDYVSPGLRDYMIAMLKFWIKTYGVDGFRFDTASDPNGPGRMIPADFWRQLGTQLRQAKPDILLLGECEDPELSRKPFALTYGWWMRDTIKAVAAGQPATIIEGTWHHQVDDFPPGTQHLSVSDDWDYPRDVNTYGGPAGALAVEAFYLTETGIPLIYNGMEIGNSAEAVNPHAPIKWSVINPEFPQFYHQMIALRHANPAFTQGKMTWLTNSAPTQILTYLRTGGGKQFLVEVNLSDAQATGTVTAPAGRPWTPVSISGVQTAGSQAAPPKIILPPKGFAIFQRSAPGP
jgi:glycosidase